MQGLEFPVFVPRAFRLGFYIADFRPLARLVNGKFAWYRRGFRGTYDRSKIGG